MVDPALFGPIDAVLAPVVEYVLLLLVFVNLGTRLLAHQTHVKQAQNDDDGIQRHPVHEVSNWLLLLASFYYLTLHYHSGIVLSLLVLGMVLTDFFEFESRRVEAREELELDRPKGAIAGSLLVFAYTAYVSLFYLIEPLWNAIV